MRLRTVSIALTSVAVAGTLGLSAQTPKASKPLECGPNAAAASIEARQAAITGATAAFVPRIELARCLDLAWRLPDVPPAIEGAIVALRGEDHRSAPVPPSAGPLQAGVDIPIPERTRFEKPKYPDRAMADGTTGIVIVDATIDRNGAVRLAQVAKSVRSLDKAAIDAVKRWKFAPSAANGVPVDVRIYLPVKFGQTPDFWASDFLELSRFYYELGLWRHAEASLTLALETARKDAARFGRIFEPDEKTPPPGFRWPTVLRDVKPKYTETAMRAKVQGKVELRVLIDRSGSVGRVAVVKFLDMLNVAAEQAAFQWKFSAGKQDGEPVSVIAGLVLEFRLH